MKNATKLNYLLDSVCCKSNAQVIGIQTREDGKTMLILDQTIFYPQGGGQPYDTGTITAGYTVFNVEEVRFHDGIVYHIGSFQGDALQQGQEVSLHVDLDRRALHSKIHTAGHLVDIALFHKLDRYMKPTKGYHFPQGPYLEYEGTIEPEEREAIRQKIEEEIAKLIAQNLSVDLKIVERAELETMCRNIPEYLPKDKPTRVMIVQGYEAIPCGGTHVSALQEIGRVRIPKVKCKSGKTRISYIVE